MIPKIITIILTIIFHSISVFLGFGMMLLAMNGYNDRAANAAIPAYIISQIIFIIISAGCSFIVCWFTQNKLQWNIYGAVSISVILGLIITVILTFIAILIGIVFGDMAFRGRI